MHRNILLELKCEPKKHIRSVRYSHGACQSADMYLTRYLTKHLLEILSYCRRNIRATQCQLTTRVHTAPYII